MQAKLKRALFEAIEALEACNLRYAIVGGLAVGAWGVRRATQDVDIYAELPTNAGPPLQRELESRGFHVPAIALELTEFGVFRSRSNDGVFLDIFNAVGPLGEAILDRRTKVDFQDRALWFATAEDVAVLKAFSDRERDFDDLVRLASTLGTKLDRRYIEDWASKLDASIGGNDVSGRLEKALKTKKKR